jgi:hypothetical protein
MEEHCAMGHPDPRMAVLADLTQPAAREVSMPRAARKINLSAGPVASVDRGVPFVADMNSVQFLKERGTDAQRLFAVSFRDEVRNHWFWLVAAEFEEQAGWKAHGVAGGSGGPAQGRRPELTHPAPWLNFCGQWGADRFYAGGELRSGNSRVGLVRVTLVDGAELTDDAVGDVALFVGRRGEPPAVVDIFDVDGSLLSSSKAF